jgi:hypothetical protein
MNSFEFNKIIGGLLGTVFVVFTLGIVSDAIFASPVPEKPGYAIVVAEAEHGGGEDRRTARRRRRHCGRGRVQEVHGLPHGREGRRQQGRPEPLGHRQPPGRQP